MVGVDGELQACRSSGRSDIGGGHPSLAHQTSSITTHLYLVPLEHFRCAGTTN